MLELPIFDEKAENYFQRCNIPAYLIQLQYNDLLLSLSDIVIKNNNGDVIRRVHIDRQLQILQRTLQGDFSNWIFCITGKMHPRRAQLLTLHILYAFANHVRTLNMPRWHRVVGGYHDGLRDQEDDFATPPFLILDGINMDSSQSKFEKIYDLLEMYSHIPRIVIGSGDNPVALMNKVHLPANRVMYFDDDPIVTEVLT